MSWWWGRASHWGRERARSGTLVTRPRRHTVPVKVDVRKSLDSYRARSGQFRLLDVPAMQYLMVDGHGDPNTAQDYADALAALYPVAYGLKFASKRGLGRDYVVPPLEALWWAADMAAFTSARDKARWSWTVMIMTPDWISAKLTRIAQVLP